MSSAAATQRVDVGGRLRRAAAPARPASRAAATARALLPVSSSTVGGRADERDARLRAGRGQVGVLGQEPVAGVDRVGAGPARGLTTSSTERYARTGWPGSPIW